MEAISQFFSFKLWEIDIESLSKFLLMETNFKFKLVFFTDNKLGSIVRVLFTLGLVTQTYSHSG